MTKANYVLQKLGEARKPSRSAESKTKGGAQLLAIGSSIRSAGVYVALNLAVWGEFSDEKAAQVFIDNQMKAGLSGCRDYKIITGSTALKLVNSPVPVTESRASKIIRSSVDEVLDPLSLGLLYSAAGSLAKVVASTGVAALLGSNLVSRVRDRHSAEDIKRKLDVSKKRLASKCPNGQSYSNLSKKCVNIISSARNGEESRSEFRRDSSPDLNTADDPYSHITYG